MSESAHRGNAPYRMQRRSATWLYAGSAMWIRTTGITAPATGAPMMLGTRDLLCGFSIRDSHITLGPVKLLNLFLIVFLLLAMTSSRAQPPPARNPDVSNKALITKSTPTINADRFKNQSAEATAAALHKMADDYYAWRNENYPVNSSDAGLHTWDD